LMAPAGMKIYNGVLVGCVFESMRRRFFQQHITAAFLSATKLSATYSFVNFSSYNFLNELKCLLFRFSNLGVWRWSP